MGTWCHSFGTQLTANGHLVLHNWHAADSKWALAVAQLARSRQQMGTWCHSFGTQQTANGHLVSLNWHAVDSKWALAVAKLARS